MGRTSGQRREAHDGSDINAERIGFISSQHLYEII